MNSEIDRIRSVAVSGVAMTGCAPPKVDFSSGGERGFVGRNGISLLRLRGGGLPPLLVGCRLYAGRADPQTKKWQKSETENSSKQTKPGHRPDLRKQCSLFDNSVNVTESLLFRGNDHLA